jgi:hypothetical protein
MPRHLSNRERIERMAAEAAAKAKSKTEKAPKSTADKPLAKPASATRRSSRGPQPMKIVWRVLSPTGHPVATFPYPARAEAEAKAAHLTQKSGGTHFVEPTKVPMDSD